MRSLEGRNKGRKRRKYKSGKAGFCGQGLQVVTTASVDAVISCRLAAA